MISEAAHAECVRLLELLTNKRVQESWSWVFMAPVAIPGYADVIKKPMDLGTVRKNLGAKPSRCRFKSHEKFARDVRLVFSNALVYNKDDQDVKGSVYDAAQHLLRVFETAYAKAIETVLRADDEAAAKRKEQDKARAREAAEGQTKEGGGNTAGHGGSSAEAAATAEAADQRHGEHRHRHHHRHHGDDEDSSSGKHKKDKSSKKDKSKKDKKSKKSKKKSKDKDKDGERDKERKHHHHPSKSSHRDSEASTVSTESAPTSASLEKSAPAAATTTTTVPPSSSSRSSSSGSSSVTKTSSAASSAVQPSKSAAPADAPKATAENKMSDEETTACLAVLMKLIKYKEGNFTPAAPFLQPVDLNHFPDYRVKVPNRMHLYGVQRKLRSGGYSSKDAFAFDVRLIFANCLVYNSDVVVSKVMRSHAVTLMKLFEAQFTKIGGSWPGIPDRWKCHQIIDELLAHRTDGQETAQWFKYPIETYYDSPDQIPYGYYDKVKVPMDLGTVSSKLHLGDYRRVQEFLDGLQLVFDNCIRYWKSEPYGQTYCDSADALTKVLQARAAQLFKTASAGNSQTEDKKKSGSSSSSSKSAHTLATTGPSAKSSSSNAEREKSKKKSSKSSSRDAASTGGFAHKDICTTILKQLRSHKMKGYRGIEIPTAGPFLHAVDTTKYPDYLSIISEPMDFAKIERKLKSDRYVSVSEFSADVHLIFSNCHKYNSDPVEGADIRAMASNLRDYFVDLYNEKLGHLDGTLDKRFADVKPAVAAAESGSLIVKLAKTEGSHSTTERVPVKVESTTAPVPKKVSASSADRTRAVSAPTAGESAAPRVSKSDSATPAKKEPTASAGSLVVTSRSEAKPAVGQPVVADPSTAASQAVSSHSSDPAKELKRKEKKEKKDKKKKDKKDKKKKKDKKHDKHDRKHDKKHDKKDPVAAATAIDAQRSSHDSNASSHIRKPGVDAAPSATATPATSRPAPPSVGSKMSRMDMPASSSSSSKKSSKKSKKSDLKSWESSCERVLNRLGKIEQVAKLHFDKPLVEVFPQLATEYNRLIAEAMDLRTLHEQLLRHELTQEEFVRKGRLIFENAVKFNSADDPASTHVRDMSAHLRWYFDSLCVELQLAPQSAKGLTRAQLRQQRAEVVTNIPMEIKAKECQKVLRVLNSQKYDKNCWPFRKPVRVLFPTLPPEYFDIIKTPMDLTTISEKLASFEYKLHGDFIRDVRLTFENALLYNRADKDRKEWNVYSAAVLMLGVTEDLLGDLTLEVSEKIRRRLLSRKERERLGEKKDKADGHHHHHHKSSSHQEASRKRADDATKKAAKATKAGDDTVIKIVKPPIDAAARPPLVPPASSSVSSAGAAASSTGVDTVVSGIVPTDSSATRIKLQLVNRPNLERMNKSERKAEEKRRKRARREEEIARSEKRRRTAVAATDDALREAEERSRRRLQKLEMAEAMRAREERERRAKEESEARALAEKRKFDAASWSGVLAQTPSSGFWSRKRVKLQVPLAFQTMINA